MASEGGSWLAALVTQTFKEKFVVVATAFVVAVVGAVGTSKITEYRVNAYGEDLKTLKEHSITREEESRRFEELKDVLNGIRQDFREERRERQDEDGKVLTETRRANDRIDKLFDALKKHDSRFASNDN